MLMLGLFLIFSESYEFTEEENKRLISICIGLKLLAKELKILQRLAAEFPEKSGKLSLDCNNSLLWW